MAYETPVALEMAVKAAAKASPLETGRAVSGFYFHRLLCRVFSKPDSPFMLKGGQSMLARTVDARATEEALSNVAETVRFSGSDRYNTSRLTAEWALENGFSCSNPVLVAGRDGKYTDALVSSSLSGGNASPLLLVDDGEAADLQIGKILVPNKGDIRQAYVIGDEWSVSAGLYAAVNTALE